MTAADGVSIHEVTELDPGSLPIRTEFGGERASGGWAFEAEYRGRRYPLRHLLGRCEVYGASRPHSVTFETAPNGRSVEGVGAADFEESRALLTLLQGGKRRNRTLKRRSGVPAVLEEFSPVWMPDELPVPNVYKAWALKLREDDLRGWATHLLVRTGVIGGDELRDPVFLRQLYETEYLPQRGPEGLKPWRTKYIDTLRKAREATPDELGSPELQELLWDRSPIASIKQGNPHFHRLEGWEEFARHAAELREARLPEDRDARCERLRELYRDLVQASVDRLGAKRQYWAKTLRYLAAIFPRDITCLVGWRHMVAVCEALTGRKPDRMITAQFRIVEAMDRALGPVGDTPEELADRACFPWFLYKHIDGRSEEDEGVEIDDEGAGDGDTQEEGPLPPFEAPSLERLLDGFRGLDLHFDDDLIARLHLSLHALPHKHFVLLAGLSGTGKTRLATSYANLYVGLESGAPNPQLCVIPVQPDWTDPSGLLGYVNPLRERVTYERTPCLRFLLEADSHPERPYFLVLDEMNLARPEYYFAPFLSAMESGLPLVVHSQQGDVDLVPHEIPWPRNLFILGTVNMDETTHAFADKVLDRAFTLELWDVDLDALRERLSGYDEDLLDHALLVLGALQTELAQFRCHVGYRSIREILDFLSVNQDTDSAALPREDALDYCVYMKVLPRIRGEDSDALRGGLDRLAEIAKRHGLHRSADRLTRMREELRSAGTTRFWN